MPTGVIFQGKLLRWELRGSGIDRTVAGDIYEDSFGIYADGEFYAVTGSAIRGISDVGDYLIVRTSARVLKLEKKDALE
jgi:hypothetical protein